MSDTNLIVVDEVCFSRGERVIFDHLSLTVPRGKITAVLGPSGTGKTTLLRLIGGQLQADSGEIYFEEKSLFSMSRKQQFQARKKMGMLFQSGALFTDMTVYENVAFPLKEHTNLQEKLISTLVTLKLESVGLSHCLHMMPNELSGGMARRVALARATVLDPQLIMYDEPFVGQDPITMETLVQLIKKLNHALEITSVIVSHDVPEVLSLADQVYLLSEGCVLAQGTPEQMMQSSDPQVQHFLTGKQPQRLLQENANVSTQ